MNCSRTVRIMGNIDTRLLCTRRTIDVNSNYDEPQFNPFVARHMHTVYLLIVLARALYHKQIAHSYFHNRRRVRLSHASAMAINSRCA